MAETLERLGSRIADHRGTERSDGDSPLGLESWYARRYALYWSVVNLATLILLATLVQHAVPPRTLAAWGVFVALNALAYPALARLTPSATGRHAAASHALQVGLAAVFGAAWGSAAMLFAPSLATDTLSALALLCVLVAFAAIPVFSVYRYAFAAFLVAFGLPLCYALFGDAGDAGAALAVVVLALLALAAGAFERMLVRPLRALRRLVGALEGAGIRPEDAAALDADFARRADAHAAALESWLRDQAADRQALHDLPEALVRTDARGLVEYMNPAAEILTGLSLRNARGEPLERVVRLQSPGETSLTRRLMECCARGGSAQAGDVAPVLVKADGTQCAVEVLVAPLRGEHPGLLCAFHDATARRRKEEAAQLLATHDPLTGLANRFEFAAALKKLVADPEAAPGTRHAVCLFDLDQFIQLNDTFGSAAGDAALEHVAELLKRKVRGVDLLARTGDDEFGVLLYGCTLEKARTLAEGLCRQIAGQPLVWRDTELTMRASAGVVEVSPLTSRLTDILGAVESACAAAHRAGGNQVQIFGADDEFMRGRNERHTRVRLVQSALEDENFELLFQAAAPLSGGAPGGRYGELLLRLRLSNGDLLRPAEFLPVAERYHLLPDIDRWVLKSALQAMHWGDPTLAGSDVVAFNVSAQTVRDESFVDFVRGSAEEFGVAGERLCFEIAEDELQAGAARAFYFVARLTDFGCQVALDDFGAGASSFQLLKRMHVDYVKLGPELVHNLAQNAVDYEIALGICRIAKQLRVRVIAEGVNNDATRKALAGLGIDLVQGHLFKRPEPLLFNPKLS
ncbi:MAG: EAL domain-containing protein [Gammaproteobacteria bacterium]|nr:EAL domain-containing protein [Gammaproteobacteria bacterium]